MPERELVNNVRGFCRAPGTENGSGPQGSKLITRSKPDSAGKIVFTFACGATYLGFNETRRNEVRETCAGCPFDPVEEAIGVVNNIIEPVEMK